MAWFRRMGVDEVAYHQATVVGRGDDHPGQALDYYGSRGETPLRWQHQEHGPSLLAVEGVAGVYGFRASTLLGTGADQGERFAVPMWNPRGRLITVVYLDDDVVATSARLDPLVRARWATGAMEGVLAGPFRSMVTNLAWPE